jgi:branched-chain amino acid transport system permease protein
VAAQAMGVHLVRMKLLAFACGASFAGAMGVVFSAKQVFINPESFTFLESIGVLAMVILGGMGSIPGAILGATVVTVLNLQVLKGLSLWLNELRNAGVTILGYNLANLPTQLSRGMTMIFGFILSCDDHWPQGIAARRHAMTLGSRGDRHPRNSGPSRAIGLNTQQWTCVEEGGSPVIGPNGAGRRCSSTSDVSTARIGRGDFQ